MESGGHGVAIGAFVLGDAEHFRGCGRAFADDAPKLLDELGDLLFQVYILALLLSEQGQGNLEQVARNAHEKLVRRHPHVFGEQDLSTAGAVRRQWDQIKREQEGREGVFHDVPDALPALLHARKVQRRAAAVGFEYPDLAGALADLEDELGELKAELDGRSSERRAAELGDLLFACVNVARRIEADPELELRQATRRFVARVGEAERLAATEGRTWTELELADQDRYFDLAKEKEKT